MRKWISTFLAVTALGIQNSNASPDCNVGHVSPVQILLLGERHKPVDIAAPDVAEQQYLPTLRLIQEALKPVASGQAIFGVETNGIETESELARLLYVWGELGVDVPEGSVFGIDSAVEYWLSLFMIYRFGVISTAKSLALMPAPIFVSDLPVKIQKDLSVAMRKSLASVELATRLLKTPWKTQLPGEVQDPALKQQLDKIEIHVLLLALLREINRLTMIVREALDSGRVVLNNPKYLPVLKSALDYSPGDGPVAVEFDKVYDNFIIPSRDEMMARRIKDKVCDPQRGGRNIISLMGSGHLCGVRRELENLLGPRVSVKVRDLRTNEQKRLHPLEDC